MENIFSNFSSLIIAIIPYLILAILLSKLYKLMYGKTTVLAWIPIANLFLLGKLCFDSNIAGWLLIGGVVILSLLMKFSLIFAYINILIIIGLVILAVYKYIKLKKKTGNLNNQ